MITIIMPVYNEGGFIYQNVLAVRDTLREARVDHRFLLVDDGSRDDSWDEMCRLAAEQGGVTVVRLARNFGKESAIYAALRHFSDNADAPGGEELSGAAVVMDSDLQHPPSYIPEMVRLWRDEGYDVVEGVKADRGRESIGSKLAALLFYRAFSKSTGIDIGVASDFKLLDRKVVEAISQLPESNTFFRGLSAWVGFRRYALPIKIAPRAGGDTKFTTRQLIRLAINSITAYTAAPLFIVFWLGLLMGLLAVGLSVHTLIQYFSHNALPGFPTVILLQLYIGSGIMLSLSVIGLYIAKIYDEVKGRPRYIVRRIQQSPQKSGPEQEIIAKKTDESGQ
ncbi:MAG: glycosyltransferase family 2 protein [Oscillospiraceae bacterium]|nr:glycosyltransferase family 2 protein [Oscillospiraceae bacterium]